MVLDDDDRLLVTSAVYHVAPEFTTASCACTVVQQRPATGYAAPRTGRVASDGGQRLSVASSSSRASLCGLRIA